MRVGIDLAKTKRWEALVKKHPQRVGTIFTEEELAHCRKKGLHAYESMAALWAVREALAKRWALVFFAPDGRMPMSAGQNMGLPSFTSKETLKRGLMNLG